jgi:hypothetical protein
MSNNANCKIPLPKFLKLLTSNSFPVQKAIAVAGKMFVFCPSLNVQAHISGQI